MSKYRQFVKHKSVFKDWIEDTPEDDDNVLETEFRHWKIPRMVRKSGNVESIEAVLYPYATILKVVFVVAVSRGGSFPRLLLNGFS
jgi:hypothetical protein